MQNYKNIFNIYLLVVTTISLTSCSTRSLFSPESGVGALAGGGIGTATGAFIAQNSSKYNSNLIPVLGLTSATVGGLAGMIAKEQAIRAASEGYVIRKPREASELQKELQISREAYIESTKWGGMEDKPFSERYITSEDEVGYYQGTQY